MGFLSIISHVAAPAVCACTHTRARSHTVQHIHVDEYLPQKRCVLLHGGAACDGSGGSMYGHIKFGMYLMLLKTIRERHVALTFGPALPRTRSLIRFLPYTTYTFSS